MISDYLDIKLFPFKPVLKSHNWSAAQQSASKFPVTKFFQSVMDIMDEVL